MYSLFVAAVCFGSAFILVTTGPPVVGTAIGQVIFWVSHGTVFGAFC